MFKDFQSKYHKHFKDNFNNYNERESERNLWQTEMVKRPNFTEVPVFKALPQFI